MANAIRTHPTAVATVSRTRITEIVRLVAVVAVVDLAATPTTIIVAVSTVVEETADQNERSSNQPNGPFADDTQSAGDAVGTTVIVAVSVTWTVISRCIVSAAVGITGTRTAVDVVDSQSAATGRTATVRSNHAAARITKISVSVAGSEAGAANSSEKQ